MSITYLDKILSNVVSEEEAISLLNSEDIVILPTETVYGLAGSAFSHHAVKKIFDTKKRPYRNPLIVHYHSIHEIEKDTFFDENARKIGEAFWPGPLTIVLRKKRDSRLSSLCTANQSTVGVRIPMHSITLSILKKFGSPIAMPSANSYQRVSPTNVSDAIYNLRDISGVEGGYCKYGIESTIIDCTKPTPVVLRHGFITPQMIFQKTKINVKENTESTNMPGNQKKHYSTKKNIRLNATEVFENEGLIAFGSTDLTSPYMVNLSKNGNLKEAARKLFYSMQKIDKSPCESICIMPIPNVDVGIAINDRLQKASFRYDPEDIRAFTQRQHLKQQRINKIVEDNSNEDDFNDECE